jgi:hypothetical protein
MTMYSIGTSRSSKGSCFAATSRCSTGLCGVQCRYSICLCSIGTSRSSKGSCCAAASRSSTGSCCPDKPRCSSGPSSGVSSRCSSGGNLGMTMKYIRNSVKIQSQNAAEFREISRNSVYCTKKFRILPEVKKSLPWTPYSGVTTAPRGKCGARGQFKVPDWGIKSSLA